MNFKLDAHIHTSETSYCGFLQAEEVVRRYHKLDYNAIVITDHLHEHFIYHLRDNKNWTKCVNAYLKGYLRAKTEGASLGLEVILGAEFRFADSPSDYLVYGITEDFLYDNPYPHRHTRKEFFEKFGTELLIIHAHPFRGGAPDILPQYIHGIEIFNGNPRHENNNHLAEAFFAKHPHMYTTKGSDTHQSGDEGRAHMTFTRPVTNSLELRQAILNKEYC